MASRMTAEQILAAKEWEGNPAVHELADEALTLKAELLAVQEELAQLTRERDSLRLELQGLEQTRQKDNEALVRERDEARAELEELGGLTTGPKSVPLQAARKIRDERDAARKALRELANFFEGFIWGVSPKPRIATAEEQIAKAREVAGDE